MQQSQRDSGRTTMSLAGEWQIRMDHASEGSRQGWFAEAFTGNAATLPGTVEDNPRIPAATKPISGQGVLHGFTAIYAYRGAVWYQREVEIPESWRGKRIELFLERCQWETHVWIGDRYQGSCNSLVAPHVYNLSETLTPGRHRLTVIVDNSNRKSDLVSDPNDAPDNTTKNYHLTTEVGEQVKLNCGGHHIWSHNWNGVLGRMELRALASVDFVAVDVYPDLSDGSVRIRIRLRNSAGLTGPVRVTARCAPQGAFSAGKESAAEWIIALTGQAEQTVEQRLKLAGPVRPWDEFTPNLYTLSLSLAGSETADAEMVVFGMRELGRRGRQFTLNGRPVFMRGTLECFIFPLTGHPPTDMPSWRKVIGIAKSYGINLFRFHTCCPPQAAFAAADELGFYFQVELPGTSCPSQDEAAEVEAYLSEELERILSTYGNHPSLLFVSMGNEQLNCGSADFHRRHQEVLARKVRFGRQSDPRHLYTSTSHPYSPDRVDDYFVSAWPVSGSQPLCGNLWGGGRVIDSSRFNTRAPETVFDYRHALQGLDRPLITHEVGQWAVYPDMRETSRYHGAQRALNFEEIGQRLKAKGMQPWSGDFTHASGMLALALYKEEIESALRTPELGGFQLLDLHDFPGQGTSTVGILNALWESKGLITPSAFRAFCAPAVMLTRLPKRIWTVDETLEAKVEMANYASADVQGEVTWTLTGEDGRLFAQGRLPGSAAQQGGLTELGTIAAPLARVAAPARLVLRAEMKEVSANAWDVWVYPSQVCTDVPPGIVVGKRWDASAREALRQGDTVLLLPDAETLRDPVPGTFTTAFWNVQMKDLQPAKTMGLLVNPADPALAGFPTSFHSDWQWWDMVMRSWAMRLDGLPKALRPAVTVVDSFTENRRLALVFEARIGSGRLLVCSVDIERDLDRRPVARQLRRCLLDYMGGPLFLPDVSVSEQELESMLKRIPRGT